MSRSQGAANSGWPPPQRHPAGEPDPRTAGRPAQRPQTPQYAAPQQAPAYPQQSYGEQSAYSAQGQPQHPQQAYHYPQQAAPQAQHYPPQQPAPAGRQALSSLDSARNAQPTHDFENFPRTQPPQYTRPPQQPAAPAQRAQYAPAPADNPINAAMGYRQAAPQPAPQYAPQRQAAQGYEGWPAAQPGHDPYSQGQADYLPAEASYPANSNQPPYDALQQADWTLAGAGYGDPSQDQQAYGRGQHGYGQGHGNALETTYNQDEGAYENEEPRRRSWAMRIAGAVVVAIGLGYGLTLVYKGLLGSPSSDSSPPVIASDSSPAKEKPLDPGGRQFSHTDSKVLGRLGEADSAPQESSGGLSESDADNGARQVKTLVVGRDGSIAPPSASAEPAAAEEAVSVPGLTVVDAFGSAAQPAPQRVAASEPVRQPDPEPAMEAPQQRSGVNVKTTKVIPSSTASIPDQETAAAPAAPKKQRVAAAAPTNDAGPSAGSAATGANGYVVVLASVPASGSSRLDALRKFADMQQQYGPVLSNKTPDVRETTLPGKGPYHRLLVGPPGSRAQASELCTQLKAYGYKDCWVTAY